MRLDLYMLTKIPDLSRTYVKKSIIDGLVYVNGAKSNPSYKLREGDKVTFDEVKIKNHYKSDRISEIVGTDIPFDVVFEDDDLLVVNKPAGLDSHPVPQNLKNTLLNAVVFYFQRTNQRLKPRLIHRLDKDTSGVMLVSKHYKSNEDYSRLFEQAKVRKYYIALVRGDFEKLAATADEGVVRERSFLARSSADKRKMDYADTLVGQLAITGFSYLGKPSDFQHELQLEAQILSKIPGQNVDFKAGVSEFLKFAKEYDTECSLVLAMPQTGRTHQIRVHLEHLGFPIVGDRLYSDIQFDRMMLHAWGLGVK